MLRLFLRLLFQRPYCCCCCCCSACSGVFPPLTDSGSIYSQMPRPRERSTIWRSGRRSRWSREYLDHRTRHRKNVSEKLFSFEDFYSFFEGSERRDRCKLLPQLKMTRAVETRSFVVETVSVVTFCHVKSERRICNFRSSQVVNVK